MSAYTEYFFYSFVSFIVLPFAFFNFIVINTSYFSTIKPFIVTSGSMEPSIKTGSIIYTVKKSDYNEGDVVTFREDKVNISHRIVGYKNISGQKYYITKGDQNESVDYNLVNTQSIYGKISTTFPFVGRAILFIKNFSV